jgi:hypothetical protein
MNDEAMACFGPKRPPPQKKSFLLEKNVEEVQTGFETWGK